ncbi:unnamed protein product [Adineta steineri]|uniref:Tubulin beta chain n=1 Tax=Adineta steineri TaxID=433720 RepID=A0A814GAP0_9BILA|nr:unnamed protein product [Adineta steineri]CAF1267616.1 unnamed protein product [Adineta steineri]
MREIIHIQLGGCGNRIGSKFWKTITDEHCIDSTGIYYGQLDESFEGINVYFNEIPKGKYCPRAILVDLEPDVINTLHNNSFNKFFCSDNIICGMILFLLNEYKDFVCVGKIGSGSSWSSGFYNDDTEVIDQVLNTIRKESELCDCLQGFQLSHSLLGGTGSGFGSLLIDKLREEYPDRAIMTFSSLASSETCEHLIEPYNIVLSIQHLIENVDATYFFDNETLHKTFSRTQTSPTYNDLNQLISTAMSGVTTCFRFPDQINGDMRKLNNHMIPFPRLHFLMSSYAPIISQTCIQNNSIPLYQLIEELFDNKNMLIPCDLQQGRYLSATAIFRGRNTTIKEIYEHMLNLQTKVKNIKTTLCKIPLKDLEISSTLIGNHTSIQNLLKYFLEKFSTIFRRKLYIFGFCRSGMDEMEFTEAESNLRDLIDEYQEIQHGKTENNEED